MKILFVHNKYGVISGEEIMIQRIIELLRDRGHEVRCFFRDSADISGQLAGQARAFFSGIYSTKSRVDIRSELREFRPDIVQIQNLFPLISPSVLPEIKLQGVPVVMRVSNYRLVCPNGLFLSHGSACERCRSGAEYWCVLRNCEDNLLKSTGYALRNWVSRKQRYFLDNVTFYYAQTNFQRACLTGEGFPEDRISVIPNMVEDGIRMPEAGIGEYIAYAGRISVEKGPAVLVDAARSCNEISFKFAGDYQRMPDLISNAPGNVEFLGHLGKDALKEFYQNCRILVLPAIWFEGFPGVLIEAMLSGKPVVCSRIGGLPEIVEDGETGLLFEPGDKEDLAKKVKYLWERPDLCKELGAAGRHKVLNEYSPERYYERLMTVYEAAMACNLGAGSGAV